MAAVKTFYTAAQMRDPFRAEPHPTSLGKRQETSKTISWPLILFKLVTFIVKPRLRYSSPFKSGHRSNIPLQKNSYVFTNKR